LVKIGFHKKMKEAGSHTFGRRTFQTKGLCVEQQVFCGCNAESKYNRRKTQIPSCVVSPECVGLVRFCSTEFGFNTKSMESSQRVVG
jgi:hypothetical protein